MKCYVVDLGRMKYEPVWDLQKRIVAARLQGLIPDTFLLVEHEPVITFGKSEKWNKLNVPESELTKLGVDFYKEVDRGGGATYHGPGQIVGYPILDLRSHNLKLGDYLRRLERTTLQTAQELGAPVKEEKELNPSGDKPYRAIWYLHDGKKHILCTKGVAIKDFRVVYHGFAFYVNNEPNFFHLIDPCGFKKEDASPISLEEIIGKKLDIDKAKQALIANFGSVFQCEIEMKTLPEIETILKQKIELKQ